MIRKRHASILHQRDIGETCRVHCRPRAEICQLLVPDHVWRRARQGGNAGSGIPGAGSISILGIPGIPGIPSMYCGMYGGVFCGTSSVAYAKQRASLMRFDLALHHHRNVNIDVNDLLGIIFGILEKLVAE